MYQRCYTNAWGEGRSRDYLTCKDNMAWNFVPEYRQSEEKRTFVGNKEKCAPFIEMERGQQTLGGKILIKASVIKVL